MEGNHHVLGETATAFGCGSFFQIVAITFGQRHHFLSEAGGYVHPNRYSPASTPLIYRTIPTQSSDSIEPTELKGKRHVSAGKFLVDEMGYLTALAPTDLSGELNYTDRNIVEKFFQTHTMPIEHFHETWNGSQTSGNRWLTAYTAYYNHHRSHQALDNQPPVETLKQRDSI